eukprot:5822458-Alexandrium_andersonii.AAC.1
MHYRPAKCSWFVPPPPLPGSLAWAHSSRREQQRQQRERSNAHERSNLREHAKARACKPASFTAAA